MATTLIEKHSVLAATVLTSVGIDVTDRVRILIVADVDPRQDEECMMVDRVLLTHAHRVAANLYEREGCVGLAVDVGQPDRMKLSVGDSIALERVGAREVFALAIVIEWVDVVDAQLLAEWHAAALEDTSHARIAFDAICEDRR